VNGGSFAGVGRSSLLVTGCRYQLSAIGEGKARSLTAFFLTHFTSFETKQRSTNRSVMPDHEEGTKVTRRNGN
jgi:hypothetical protein